MSRATRTGMPGVGTAVIAWFLLCLLAGMLMALPLARAAIDVDELESPELRARYHALIEELRCPKCQNQNLAGSDAPIATDLRQELRRQLRAGQSDAQILDFLVARYGEFISYRPPFDARTALLWLGPALMVGAGAIIIIVLLRRHRPRASPALSAAERERLHRLLEEDSPQ